MWMHCPPPPGVSSPLSTAGPLHIAMELQWLPCANLLREGKCEQMTCLSAVIWNRGPIAQLVKHLTYKVRGHEFQSHSGRLFSHTFTFHYNENVSKEAFESSLHLVGYDIKKLVFEHIQKLKLKWSCLKLINALYDLMKRFELEVLLLKLISRF